MKKYDILNMEWGSKVRDSNIVMPVLVYLEEEEKYTIKRSSVAYGVLKLLVYRPKMLVISNLSGAPENYRIVKYAYLLGIKTVSLISEGDVVDERRKVEGFFWGWCSEKVCYLDLWLLWSERSKRLFEKYIPESKLFNIKISGATGFDRYKLLKDTYMTKQMFCYKYKRKYNKIIGISSWGFSYCFAEKSNDERKRFYVMSCLELRKILKNVICHFKDVLFVLRPHPGEISKENEFVGLETLENVIIIQGKDETVSDNINICDIWMAYDSTTCMEAWLLNKVTLLINPFPIEYSRSIIHRGSPIMQNEKEVISCIEEFYRNGKIEEFERLETERKKIIHDVIGYDDGKNFIRAAKEIVTVMNSKIERNKKITGGFLYELAKDIFRWGCHHSFLNKIGSQKVRASYYYDFKQKESDDERKAYYTAIYGENCKY